METMEEKMLQQGYLTVSKASKIMGKSVHTLYRWIRTGKVDGEKVFGHWFITVASLAARLGPDRARAFGLIDAKAQ